MIETKKIRALERMAVAPPLVSPTGSNNSDHTMVTVASDVTLIGDNDVSEWEEGAYYTGVCANDKEIPLLKWRTSLKRAPFPTPSPEQRFFRLNAHKASFPPHPLTVFTPRYLRPFFICSQLIGSDSCFYR
jgi:hypothetical protein